MTGLEVVAIRLGAAIFKAATKAWAGDAFGGQELADAAGNLAQTGLDDVVARRKAKRFSEECADAIAERLMATMRREFQGIDDDDRQVAVDGVIDVLSDPSLRLSEVIKRNGSPSAVLQQLEPRAERFVATAGLGEAGEAFFRMLLVESCTYVVNVTRVLPAYSSEGITELLARTSKISEELDRLLTSLPTRRGTDDFATDYIRQVSVQLDKMELFGAGLDGRESSYPLSVSYLSLQADLHSSWRYRELTRGSLDEAMRQAQLSFEQEWRRTTVFGSSPGRVEDALAGATKILLIGEAGSGKTTLLRWLAVQAARQTFDDPLLAWNTAIPFYIRLRQYSRLDLPAPENFLDYVGRSIAGEMPPGWVHERLRSGEALVLVDGYDEMLSARRGEVRQWLSDLMDAFPRARFVITSRPEAIGKLWFDADDFVVAELQPMAPDDVRKLVRHWHAAMGTMLTDSGELASLREDEQAINAALRIDRHLRRLAVNPLLCALLCALNRRLNARLPESRQETYEAALGMLIGQRDRERSIEVERSLRLTQVQRLHLLQRIALWLVRNGRSDASTDEVRTQVDWFLARVSWADEPPNTDSVMSYLLERSGVLREPVVGRVDFIHKTFQEYLAAKAILDEDAIDELVRNARDDQWREVVILAAGQAHSNQRDSLLSRLLQKSRRRGPQDFVLLCLACLQESPLVDPELRQEIEDQVRTILPPRDDDAVRALAGAGSFVLDIMPTPTTETSVAACIQLAMQIGGEDGLNYMAKLADGDCLNSQSSLNVLSAAWGRFNADVFVEQVLKGIDLSAYKLSVTGPAQLRLVSRLKNLTWLGVNVADLTALEELPPVESVSSLTLNSFTVLKDELIEWKGDIGEGVRRIRMEKETFIDQQDFERAAAARDQEKQLMRLELLQRLRSISRVFPHMSRLQLLDINIPRLSLLESIPSVQTLVLVASSVGSFDSVSDWVGVEQVGVGKESSQAVLADIEQILRMPSLQKLVLMVDDNASPDWSTLSVAADSSGVEIIVTGVRERPKGLQFPANIEFRTA